MRVARVESVGNAPASLVDHDVSRPIVHSAGEGPMIKAEALGDLEGAARIDCGAVR
jgi:hypothetical protein